MVEILTVMVIIAILMGMVFGVFPYVTRASKDKRIRAQIQALNVIFENYNTDWGFYPQASEPMNLSATFYSGLVSPTDKQYIDKTELNFPKHPDHTYVDAYGNPFRYECPGTMTPERFDLWSQGQDGLPGFGGEDDDAANGVDDAAEAQTNSARESDDIANWKSN
jgi:general secretion pathway protein G